MKTNSAILLSPHFSARRKRSGDTNDVSYSYPFLEQLDRMGYDRLEDSECQKMIFCQMAEMGGAEEANFVQKLFGYVVAASPDVATDLVGVKDVFQVNCFIYV